MLTAAFPTADSRAMRLVRRSRPENMTDRCRRRKSGMEMTGMPAGL